MQVTVTVATLEGCKEHQLDDPSFLSYVLREAIAAGNMTLLHEHAHKFEPQGVTVMALLAESHAALHSWPECGLLFVDLATCSSAKSAMDAFDRICQLVPHANVDRRDWHLIRQEKDPCALAG